MMNARLTLTGITKKYPSVVANDGVSLTVQPGEIHAVLGENGAGKSTLMKILMGIHQPDQGEVRLEGQPVVVPDPIDAFAMGIAIVFQEIELCPNLGIRENLYLGRELNRRAGLDFKPMRDRTAQVLAEVGLNLDPETPVEKLSVAHKQLVQIALQDLAVGLRACVVRGGFRHDTPRWSEGFDLDPVDSFRPGLPAMR